MNTVARARLVTTTERVPAPSGRVTVDHAPRCWNCNRPLFEQAGRPWVKRCDACKAHNARPQE